MLAKWCTDASATHVSGLNKRSAEQLQRRRTHLSFGAGPLTALKWFRDNKAKDHRDNVYSLLGLMGLHNDFPVDYNRPVWKVFADTVIHSAGLDTSIFSSVGHGKPLSYHVNCRPGCQDGIRSRPPRFGEMSQKTHSWKRNTCTGVFTRRVRFGQCVKLVV